MWYSIDKVLKLLDKPINVVISSRKIKCQFCGRKLEHMKDKQNCYYCNKCKIIIIKFENC